MSEFNRLDFNTHIQEALKDADMLHRVGDLLCPSFFFPPSTFNFVTPQMLTPQTITRNSIKWGEGNLNHFLSIYIRFTVICIFKKDLSDLVQVFVHPLQLLLLYEGLQPQNEHTTHIIYVNF